jgi:type III restriction enzyme
MAVIDNPILNSPFVEPTRHFKFDADGITDEILTGRRPSSHFVPIPRAKKTGKQLQFETEWTKDRIEPNPAVDRIRQRVGAWRQGGYVGVTGTTSRLLAHWTREARDKPLFFCQIEAAETAIYITEVARKYGDAWIGNDLRLANDTSNPGLPRLALKMATGSGKTVVMAMLIAWQALNKLEDRQDGRFSDAFLIVTPGITIRDRLRVLLPTDPDNYYRQRDVLPSDLLERLTQARSTHELRGQRPGAIRCGVRRGLRRAVLVHSLFRLEHEPESRPDSHAGQGSRRSHRLRDHLPEAARISL